MAGFDHSMRGDVMRFFSEMREGSRRQGNVIFALIFKDVKTRAGGGRYGLLSLVGPLVEPAVAAAVITLIFYYMRAMQPLGVHIALWITVSYLPFGIIRRSLSSIPRVVRSNAAFYAYQQVKPFDAIIASFILEVALLLFGSMLAFFTLGWFFDLVPNFNEPLGVLGIFGMMALTGLGISLFIGTYGTLYPIISTVASFSSRALFLASAVIHPISHVYGQVGDLLLWNPLVHMEEYIRFYALGLPVFQGVTLTFPAGYMLTILFLGFVGYYVNRYELLRR